MFLDDPTFRSMVADALKMDVADLAAYWDRQCQQAHLSAYKDIRGALLVRGFAPAQVDQWDRGPEFEQDIGLFWAFTRGIGARAVEQATLEKLDRRLELQTVAVELAGGPPQIPTGTPPAIDGGLMSNFLNADGTDVIDRPQRYGWDGPYPWWGW